MLSLVIYQTLLSNVINTELRHVIKKQVKVKSSKARPDTFVIYPRTFDGESHLICRILVLPNIDLKGHFNELIYFKKTFLLPQTERF